MSNGSLTDLGILVESLDNQKRIPTNPSEATKSLIETIRQLKNEIPEPVKQDLQNYGSKVYSDFLEKARTAYPDIDPALLDKIIRTARNSVEYDPKINKLKATKSGMKFFLTSVLSFFVFYILKKYVHVPVEILTPDIVNFIALGIASGIGAVISAIHKSWSNRKKFLRVK